MFRERVQTVVTGSRAYLLALAAGVGAYFVAGQIAALLSVVAVLAIFVLGFGVRLRSRGLY